MPEPDDDQGTAAPAAFAAREQAALIAVVVATFVAFIPALSNGFVSWDDDYMIVDNPYFRGFGWKQLRWIFVGSWDTYYLPLSWLSYAVDYALWGLNPAGFHLTSLLLHCACAAVFCLLSARLWPPASSLDRALAAGFAALVFSLHPLRVECVAWAADRRDVLCGLFYLLSLLFYVQAAAAEKPRWRLAASFAAFLLAASSRVVGVTLPAVFVLLDVYPLRRLRAPFLRRSVREDRAVWREKIPYAAALAAGVFVYLTDLGTQKCGMAWANYGLAQRAAQAAYGTAFYLRKTLWPSGLSPMHLHPSFDPWAAPYVMSAAAVVALAGLAVARRKRWPFLPAAGACYLAILGPFLGFFPCGRHIAADRYSYLACLPWAALAGAGLLALLRARRIPRAVPLALAAAVLGALGRLTWSQTKVWKDTESLWTQALKVREDHPYAHCALGTYLAQNGRMDEALPHLRRAVALAPNEAQSLNSLGCALAGRGELEEATALFSKALQLSPDYREARLNLEKVQAMKAPARAPAGAPGPGRARVRPPARPAP